MDKRHHMGPDKSSAGRDKQRQVLQNRGLKGSITNQEGDLHRTCRQSSRLGPGSILFVHGSRRKFLRA